MLFSILIPLVFALKALAAPMSSRHAAVVAALCSFVEFSSSFPIKCTGVVGRRSKDVFRQLSPSPTADDRDPFYIGEFGTMSSSTQRIFFRYHMDPPKPSLEKLNVFKELESSSDDFLYLSSSWEMRELLKQDDRTILDTLLDILRNQLDHTWEISFNHDKLFHMDSSLERGTVGDFHLDGSSGSPYFKQMMKNPDSCFMINVWIAKGDISGHPLAFARPSRPPKSTVAILPFDESHDYKFVPGMKNSEMLVFKGGHVWHGSPALESGGSRESVFARFDVRKVAD